MAKDQPSKKGVKPPITRHPLLPAVVALWFGALFGIGSLAIRPGLLESLVVALRIDAIIPSAAPPIGATGQILLALVMAGTGGLLGGWLARRVARPKPVVVQRKRGAGRTAESAGSRGRTGDAPGRRSSLALSEETQRYNPVAHVPLPGSATILDVSQFDLDGFEEKAPASSREFEAVDWQAQATDQRDEPEPWQAGPFERNDQAEPPFAAWRPEAGQDDLPEGAQVFQPLADQDTTVDNQSAAHAEPDFPDSAGAADQALPDETGRQVFGQAPQGFARPFGEPDQAFEGSMADASPLPDHDPMPAVDEPESAPEAQVDTSPEHEPEPLSRLQDENNEAPFEPIPPRVRPGSVFDQKAAPALFTQPLQAQVPNIGWDNNALQSPVSGQQAEQPEEPAATWIVTSPSAPVAEENTAASRIAGAPLQDLSHLELLERLAGSMRRKRADSAHAPLPEQPAPAPVDEQPLDEPVTATEEYGLQAPPPIPVIPEALRPVGLGADDGDHELLPIEVPPRHFIQRATESASSVSAIAPEPDHAPAPADRAEEDDLALGYSSLLDLSRPATGPQRFVRIEEPSPATGEIEPVVVFPGKEPRAEDGPFSRPNGANPQDQAPSHSAGAVPFRPDPEETDRALRSALANIQRMSGAA